MKVDSFGFTEFGNGLYQSRDLQVPMTLRIDRNLWVLLAGFRVFLDAPQTRGPHQRQSDMIACLEPILGKVRQALMRCLDLRDHLSMISHLK